MSIASRYIIDHLRNLVARYPKALLLFHIRQARYHLWCKMYE